MKILLRYHNEGQYVWKRAKYNQDNFYVDGEREPQSNIVSIINDNRKKYIQCSSCGQVFRRGDPRFEEHKAKASSPETCFKCKHMSVDDAIFVGRKFIANPDGSFTEKAERTVNLTCSNSGLWSYDSINSNRAIHNCKRRQCGTAKETEIYDFFISRPGVFDDLITIDKLMDDGHNVTLRNGVDSTYEIAYDDDYTVVAVINSIGIVDRFIVWYDGDKHIVYYSKKYDELFRSNPASKYVVWEHPDVPDDRRTVIKEKIANLYR